MTLAIDFLSDGVHRWERSESGLRHTVDTDYVPSMYVTTRSGERDERLEWLATALQPDPKVTDTAWERWYTALRDRRRRSVLRVDLAAIEDVRQLAREIRTQHERDRYPPGTFACYNVDFTPGFRYCLETATAPVPRGELRIGRVDLPEPHLADRNLGGLRYEGERFEGNDRAILRALERAIERDDPDILLLSSADIVPFVFERAAAVGCRPYRLGRLPGYQRLAGESTMETYGRVLHSPARYNLPGRVIIDRSNSFMWSKSGLPGLCDLVERSHKPLQEAGWASIGNLLTAIQIREAVQERDLLVPATKTQHERFKRVETLHAADRGGFIFDPDVGLHEDIYGLDFSSLYPNIMIEHNISPETVRCPCHRDRSDVPELGYAVCDEPGFIPAVLEPIVADRDAIKARRRAADDPETIERLESKSEALKWILVTCFGYQGYKNSKFGRIEAHEAINAYARDILLTAKEYFEDHGWRIVHGIVDSVWVEPMAGRSPTPIERVAEHISAAVDVRLEYEHRYEWICFVPKRDSSAGALTKYFGKIRGDDSFKVRGIEIRQRHTPPFVTAAQRTFMAALDRHRSASAVIDACTRSVQELRAGSVDPDELVIRRRVSKPLEAYTQTTRGVAAMHRYRDHGIDKQPGQDVRYVVVNDAADRPPQRVRLPFESIDGYDTTVYVDLLLRACESILAPIGWDRADIERELRGGRDVGLAAFE